MTTQNQTPNQIKLQPLIFDIDYYIETLIKKLQDKNCINDDEADDLYTFAFLYKRLQNTK